MTEAAQTATFPVMITILTATNTLLVGIVAFFLARFMKSFDKVVTTVNLHEVILNTSSALNEERSKRVDNDLESLESDQKRQDSEIAEHTKLLAQHTTEIDNIKRSMPEKRWTRKNQKNSAE